MPKIGSKIKPASEQGFMIADAKYVQYSDDNETQSIKDVLDNKVFVGTTTPAETSPEAKSITVDSVLYKLPSGGGGGSGATNLLNGSAEGSLRTINSKAENENYTIGESAFAEGRDTMASGKYSHAEGSNTTASGQSSHAEGDSTVASGTASHVQGKFNIKDTDGNYADIVGWGTDDNNRKNISSLTTTGDLHLKGSIFINSNDDGTDGINLNAIIANKNNIFRGNNLGSITDKTSAATFIDNAFNNGFLGDCVSIQAIDATNSKNYTTDWMIAGFNIFKNQGVYPWHRNDIPENHIVLIPKQCIPLNKTDTCTGNCANCDSLVSCKSANMEQDDNGNQLSNEVAFKYGYSGTYMNRILLNSIDNALTTTLGGYYGKGGHLVRRYSYITNARNSEGQSASGAGLFGYALSTGYPIKVIEGEPSRYVNTYADLLAIDRSKLENEEYLCVDKDETYNSLITFYQYIKGDTETPFHFVSPYHYQYCSVILPSEFEFMGGTAFSSSYYDNSFNFAKLPVFNFISLLEYEGLGFWTRCYASCGKASGKIVYNQCVAIRSNGYVAGDASVYIGKPTDVNIQSALGIRPMIILG